MSERAYEKVEVVSERGMKSRGDEREGYAKVEVVCEMGMNK